MLFAVAANICGLKTKVKQVVIVITTYWNACVLEEKKKERMWADLRQSFCYVSYCVCVGGGGVYAAAVGGCKCVSCCVCCAVTSTNRDSHASCFTPHFHRKTLNEGCRALIHQPLHATQTNQMVLRHKQKRPGCTLCFKVAANLFLVALEFLDQFPLLGGPCANY